ncbi:MAG: hypothetical protein IKS19_01350 [Clostridia bacterium]|nr:hypothetical protein [Clostridia bacterium]
MKKTRLLSLLLVIALCFGGCSSAVRDNRSGSAGHSSEAVSYAPAADTQQNSLPEPPSQPQLSPEEQEKQRIDKAVRELMSSMTLREKVCQMFIVEPEQLADSGLVTEAGEKMKEALRENPVGGVILFASNIKNPEQVTKLAEDLQAFSKTKLFISTDEEGGIVARVGNNRKMGTTKFKPMGKTKSADEAYNVGFTIGSELSEFGFNLDFAPVADVNSNPKNPVIGTRAFSRDAETAAEYVAACVNGFCDSGMLCTLKHFPGHGDTSTDSHYGAAKTKKTLEQLEQCELLPFEAGIEAGADFVMAGHITAPELTDEKVPATLSHDIITGILRDKMGFDGIVITDSMQMQAITDYFSPGEAAEAAVNAGADIILMPEDLDKAVNGLVEAVEKGDIDEQRINESVGRILRVKLKQGIIEP